MARAQAAGEYDGYRLHSTASTAAGGVFELPPIARDDAAAATVADAGDPRWRDTLTEPRSLPEDSLRERECRQAAAWIAARIADPTQPVAPRDVMVLARRRAPLGVLEAELRALGIAATQPEQRRLADAWEVQDIVALLDALVSPGHDLSIARMLRSPLFSVDDDALVQIALAKRANPAASWFELLLNPKQEMQVLLKQKPDLPHKLRRWKDWLDQCSPHDALAAIYHDGDVLARFAAAAPAPLRETVLANLRAILSAALRIDAARYATPYALVRALKSRFGPMAPASSTPDAVRLLTVHGAKGLEAPLVLLLDAQAHVRQRDSMGVLVDWPGEAAAPQRFVFLPSEARPSACCIDLLAAEQAARAREELNALYVAMTRARAQLVLSSVEPGRAAATPSWHGRIAPHAAPIDAGAPAGGVGSHGLAAAAARQLDVGPSFLISELPEAQLYAASSAMNTGVNGEFDTATAPIDAGAVAELRIGAALQRLLAWAPLNPHGVPPAQVAAVTREFALAPAEARRAAALAQQLLTETASWAWDAALVDWHENALELVDASGVVVQLDRLVRRIDTGHWWVLRYAFVWNVPTLPHEAPAAQAHRLRDAVRAAQPGAVVRVALVSADGQLSEAP